MCAELWTARFSLRDMLCLDVKSSKKVIQNNRVNNFTVLLGRHTYRSICVCVYENTPTHWSKSIQDIEALITESVLFYRTIIVSVRPAKLKLQQCFWIKLELNTTKNIYIKAKANISGHITAGWSHS